MSNPTTYAGAKVAICTTVQNNDLTPGAGPVQSAAATAATGGTVPAGTYDIVVTAVFSNGESSKSNEQSITTTGAVSTITANWAAATPPAGATLTGYNVYLGTATGAENVYAFASGAVTTLVLTALPTTAGTPPSGAAASSLTYVPIAKVGQLGQFGYKTNMISYKVFDRLLDLKAKGSTDGGSLTIECATDKADPGQLAANVAANPSVADNYAFKITYANGDVDYVRGPIGGPESKGGSNESFRVSVYTVGVNQLIQ